jgi:hypothetical protein
MQNICLLPHKVYHIQADRLIIKVHEKIFSGYIDCDNWIAAYRKNIGMFFLGLTPMNISIKLIDSSIHYTLLSLLFIACQLNVSLPRRCYAVALTLNAYRPFPVDIPCGSGGDKLLILQQWLHRQHGTQMRIVDR